MEANDTYEFSSAMSVVFNASATFAFDINCVYNAFYHIHGLINLQGRGGMFYH